MDNQRYHSLMKHERGPLTNSLRWRCLRDLWVALTLVTVAISYSSGSGSVLDMESGWVRHLWSATICVNVLAGAVWLWRPGRGRWARAWLEVRIGQVAPGDGGVRGRQSSRRPADGGGGWGRRGGRGSSLVRRFRLYLRRCMAGRRGVEQSVAAAPRAVTVLNKRFSSLDDVTHWGEGEHRN